MENKSEMKKSQYKIIEGEVPTISELWNSAAPTWDQHVGQEGDWYRRYVTDSIVWSYIGDIKDHVVLDAGIVLLNQKIKNKKNYHS